MIFLLQSCTMRLHTTHPTSLYNSHGQMQTTKQDMHEHSWLKRAWLTGAIQARVIQAHTSGTQERLAACFAA
jgi:predicted nicotinamide N-methyase